MSSVFRCYIIVGRPGSMKRSIEDRVIYPRISRINADYLIGNLVGFSLPFGEGLLGFIAQELLHNQLTLANWKRYFAINKIVVEGDLCGVFARVTVENFANACPINRREAHRTRFATGVEFASVEVESFEPPAGVADGHDFGVG